MWHLPCAEVNNRVRESCCDSWLLKCLSLAHLLAHPSLHPSPLLVDLEIISTAAAPPVLCPASQAPPVGIKTVLCQVCIC